MTADPHDRSSTRQLGGDLFTAILVAVAGACWLAWLHPVGTNSGSELVAGTVGVLSVAVPLALAILPATLAAARRRTATAVAPLLMSTVVAAIVLSVSNQARLLLAAPTRPRLGVLVTTGSDAAVLLVVVLPLTALVLGVRARRPGRHRPRRAALAIGVGLVTLLGTAGISPTVAGAASATDSSCLAGGPVDKSFDLRALDVNIPVNRFGDHDPQGVMYARTDAVAAIRAEEATQQVSTGLHDDPIQPLVIRANEGDCVEITFTNDSAVGDVGVHIDGLEFMVSSSGDSLGANASSAAARGTSMVYRFAIPNEPLLEGGHYMHPGPGFRAAVDHGLFGALVVEPPGSTYWDATTPRQPLLSGWEAIIKPAGVSAACVPTGYAATCGFREAALLHHEIGNDNEELLDKNGVLLPVIDTTTGSYRPGSFALNYRSEPFRNRLINNPKQKSHAYSSFTFGDPATPIMRGYLADPTKIRLMHAGGEKFHVYHLHGGGDRWRFNPVADPSYNYAETGLRKYQTTQLSPSQRLDSQSIGPGESYNLEVEGGAGGVQQSPGDFLFHCHIAKHYNSGMWGLWRAYDTRQPDLVPLWDRTAPPAAVDSRGLLNRTVAGTKITRSTLDAWVRPQLPPQGIPQNADDATVWNWKVAGDATAPLYLGAPADPTVYPDSTKVVPGQPNLLPLDVGHIVDNRPAILFNPLNGRPAYPMFRTSIGTRPPFTGAGHTGTPYLGNVAATSATKPIDSFAKRPDGLCPRASKVRTFNIVSIHKSVRRTPTLVDPDGKLFVLAHDKVATYADPNKSDPLAIRANAGDCVAITLTNEIEDASVFDRFSKASMHIHHVQFDVQGSDGVSAGYAYEHSVRPYLFTDPTLLDPVAKGDTVLHLSNVSTFIGLDANGKPTRPWIAAGEGTESIDIHQIATVDRVAGTVTLATPLDSAHAAGQFAGSEFIQYRWYPDVVLDNVFWHDHVDGIHGWGHGLVGQLIVEPAGSTYHDPVTGAEVDSGTLVDIHTTSPLAPGLVDGSFRELALWTINDNDQSAFSTLNLRAAPLADRPDKANQFSSYMYGDPTTPLPRLYPDDPLVVRTISISPTLDTLHLQGGRTLLEPRYTAYIGPGGTAAPEGQIVDTVHYGISEKYTLVFNGADATSRMRPGDYLYLSGNDGHLQQGAWGIVRVLPGSVDTLQPLPGVAAPTTPYTLPVQTGGAPPAAEGLDEPCPGAGAPTKQFAITAMSVGGGGLRGAQSVYVPNADVLAVGRRTKAPSPLVLHVVAGDCVKVDLTNALTTPVGFSVGKLDRTAASGGVNVGFSPEQNVAPGATRQYVYYASTDRLGTALIADLAGGPVAAGLSGTAVAAPTLKQGLYGAIVVSPASATAGEVTTFRDQATGAPTNIGAQVLVHVPGASTPDYRDFTVTMADDDAAIGQDFMPYPTNAKAGNSLINYGAAAFGDGAGAFVDPGSTPWLRSFAGDPELVHVLVTPGSEQAHVFSMGGLPWQQDSFMTGSQRLTAQTVGPWESLDVRMLGGAGGTQHAVGDFFYGDLRRPFTQAGLWGLQRVFSPTSGCPIRRLDGSSC